ncbi:MAG: glycogen/starch/alpha-glucan phosphorylase [Puniceicoccales bacterium]|jgi:starch phosphorylase|nr:glycogen/starch/alpha-glucan phosphorylase [Puniceicoccales bacterium]
MDTKRLRAVRTAKCGNPLASTRTPWRVDQMRERIVKHLERMLARDPQSAELRDWWLADVYTLRDRILERFIATQRAQHSAKCRRVYYLSMEYLMGRLLRDNLNNCGLFDLNREALRQLGISFEKMERMEPDMGLGNGGLGRLAACYLDSLATLNYPAVGYGIHYEFGMFRQEFRDCRQVEMADNWLIYGNPWQILRAENVQEVRLYGSVENHCDGKGNYRPRWVGGALLRGVPWDIPIVGYGAETVNFLRLWEARATCDLDLDDFNRGNFHEAVDAKVLVETVTKVLYPNDSSVEGKALRLIQQYFLVSCSLRDIIRRHRNSGGDWDQFTEKVCIQLNDTHPTIAIVELLRILVDEEAVDWDRAWGIVTSTFAFTNHTLLPEALEKWSIALFEYILPRHMQLIYEINRRFLEKVAVRYPGDLEALRDLSLIEEGPVRYVRMGNLAVVGCFSVNGVAAMHSELVKTSLFPRFYAMGPEKFNNKTNGVTPRRWINSANPRLAALLNGAIGPEWVTDLDLLRNLEPFANDLEFRNDFARMKLQNKTDLANALEVRCGVTVNPRSLFDVQIKRIHEYKRQHLKLLHILTHYHRLLNGTAKDATARTFIFGGKAAPGYAMAKHIIHAINLVAEQINGDRRLSDRMRVAFCPNYDVSSAMAIVPAADLSEQISTAGMEASGTGNMKLALNGALTVGTLDGANVEILQEVGENNIFIFGHRAEQLEKMRRTGYDPRSFYEGDEELKAVLDWMFSDAFDRPGEFNPIRHVADSLLNGGDRYFLLADYRSYVDVQDLISKYYANQELWYSMAIINVARMGKFSSDRAIREYARDIWKIKPLRQG